MKSATATNRKISWFAREESVGTLDLTPAFQRRPVWKPEQSSYLVDSIINGLPFPEIYIRASTSPDGVTTYEVVDGQQRIRSILDFARNDLVLSGEDVSPRLLGKSFDDLSDAEKKGFWNYDVVTRELAEATDGDIRDLFRRLNISAVTLNEQELRHARYTGDFLKSMEELADDEWWVESRIVNVRQVRRMEDVEFVSELFVALMAGPQDKKLTLEQYFEDFETFPDRNTWVARFHKTRELLCSILEPEDVRAWNGKSDFYSLFQVLGTFVERGTKFNTRQRDSVREALRRFRRDVNQAKRRDNERKFPQRVHDYADAVTRAATDIARRKRRLEILLDLIKTARANA
jgi:Protein of unknown function DUF262